MNIKKELRKLNSNKSGKLWDKLTEEHKQEILLAYEESFDEKNLIPHEEVVKSLQKWLI